MGLDADGKVAGEAAGLWREQWGYWVYWAERVNRT